jgi:hypothetical protein
MLKKDNQRPNAAHKLSGPKLGEQLALRLPQRYYGQLDALVGPLFSVALLP